jgi:hypothetical protein
LGIVSRKKQIRIIITALAAFLVFIITAATVLTLFYQRSQAATDTVTTYSFDPAQERWVKINHSVRLPSNPDGSQPRSSHTLEIQLDDDNPVKAIWIEEALIIDDGDGDGGSLLEIDGDPNSSDSTIRICNLVLHKVDAEELEIDDTEVVRLDAVNVVGEDSELDIDVEVVNVIRCGRGGASTLFLGVRREDLIDKIANVILRTEDREILRGIPRRETGIRVDRIRIEGPSDGDGFIEHLVIRHTSVFGKIEIRDVEIQNVLLMDVTVED